MDGSSLAPVLARLVRLAPPDYIAVTPAGEASLHADITFKRHGKQHRFLLVIDLDLGDLLVRERIPTLPTYCPERHIVDNGVFCLGRDWRAPADDAAARIWWMSLARYLELQVDANLTGRWPPEHGLRHGIAADWQELIDKILEDMGEDFESAVQSGRIRLIDDGGRPVLRTKDGRVTNMRAPCPCAATRHGRPVLRRDCKAHRNLLAYLARAVEGMIEAEHHFWADARAVGHSCCGTMQNCQLATVRE